MQRGPLQDTSQLKNQRLEIKKNLQGTNSEGKEAREAKEGIQINDLEHKEEINTQQEQKEETRIQKEKKKRIV